MRSVFLLCLSLYHGTQTIGAQEHPHRHRLRLYHASAYTYQQERHTEPHRPPQHMLPAQCTIERETTRLSGYRQPQPLQMAAGQPQRAHRSTPAQAAALPCERVHIPTGTAHTAPQTAGQIHTGTMYHRARDSAPQRLQRAQAAALPCERLPSGHRNGYRQPQRWLPA